MREKANCKLKFKFVNKQKAEDNAPTGQHAYLCPICKYFHLASDKTRKERGLSPSYV